jgi:hypothetical protein
MEASESSEHKEPSDIVEGEIKELTNQFHITLRANYFRSRMADGKPSTETLARIDALLNARRPQGIRWSEAYEVEQLMVEVYDEAALATESQVRVIEAVKTLHPQLAAFYRDKLTDKEPLPRRRSLLARLVNDLQWRYTVNEVKRRYSKDITRRTGEIFATSMLLFALATGFMIVDQQLALDLIPSHLAYLIVAALAGTWGATFSMLGSLKSRLEASELDDMKLIRPVVMLLSRALIGTGAGCVLYFLIASGLLGGGAFPEEANLGSYDFKTLALLIVWCFIAGFSEKLVPGILEKNLARLGATTSPDPGRYRPARPDNAPPEPSPEQAGKTAGDAKPPQGGS